MMRNDHRVRLGQVLLVCLSVAAFLVTGSPASAAPPGACPDVQLVSVRGSGVPQEQLGAPLDATAASFTATMKTLGSSATVTNLVYPAAAVPMDLTDTASWSQLQASVQTGRDNLVALLNTTAQRCPGTTQRVMGHSQGAWATTLALAPTPDHPTLSPAAAASLDAIYVFGDPARDPDSPVATGSDDRTRPGIGRWIAGFNPFDTSVTWPYVADTFTGRVRSECNEGDPVCGFSLLSAGTVVSCQLQDPACPHARYQSDAAARWLTAPAGRDTRRPGTSWHAHS